MEPQDALVSPTTPTSTQKVSGSITDKIAKLLLLLGILGAAMQWMGSAGLFRSGALPQWLEMILELIRYMLWSFAVPAVLLGAILLVVAQRRTQQSVSSQKASVPRGWLTLLNGLALFVAVAVGLLCQLMNIDNPYPTFMERLYPVVGLLYFLGILITVVLSQKKRSYMWAVLPSFILFGLLFAYGAVDWLLKVALFY